MNACGCGLDNLRPVDLAIAELLDQAPRPPATQRVPLDMALGMILAADVMAPRPGPAWDNSAMDGYALRASDLPAEGGYLPLAGRIAAGDAALDELPAGHAVRIFTGAPLPAGADSVVPQEQAKAGEGGVWLPACWPGDHVRRCGEEFRQGARLLEAGQRLRAAELGLLASQGIASVAVYRPLRVGLLSTGDELCAPGDVLKRGQIYDANTYSLAAMLRGWQLEVGELGRLPDDPQACRATLGKAATEWDVLITSGGVSVGEEDHLKASVEALGELRLWRLAIQPGKPFAFGRVGNTPWLGLPGNPVAALLCLQVVARPFLLRAQGRLEVLPRAMPVMAGFDWPRANLRRQYLRAWLTSTPAGIRVIPHAWQGSAMLSGMCGAEGLAVIEAHRTLRIGEQVDFISFDTLAA
ncbi:molybdopterin molybdotransferase MoeA [Pseudomonas putida]|uniref:Molybdopterin molybdenumtransferase n=1 Tax=Pseudomonas putida TaxID=303 RepID=A0A6I6XQK7_PSEPU|nr:gephyrin-like molybdotransferase Glp [Pseudomonas putida]QHG68058.1 molybdopterin molybdotransferase MoeA [Pseudomonas putida]